MQKIYKICKGNKKIMGNNIKTVKLPDGSEMPKLGQGTWQMAEDDA